MSISVEWEAQGLCIKAHKEINFDTLNTQFASIVADPRYENCQYTLFDALDVAFVSMDLDKLKDVAGTFLAGIARTAEFKFALVFKEETIEEEIKVYLSQTESSARQVQFFRSLDDARQWLAE